MEKLLSGSKFDYFEYAHSEFYRICWNFVNADRPTLVQLPLYRHLFNPNHNKAFPFLTEWRKEREVEIKIRNGDKDYTSVIHARLEAKRWFYLHILTPWSECKKEGLIPFIERIGGNVPVAWNELYEQRREHELLKYKESFKRDAQKSPYPKAKIELELSWWSWVLFPEQVAIPTGKFVKRFEADASFKEIRTLADAIIEGNAKFEQIGILEGVGWRKYAMADARIQYREWLAENKGNERIWEVDKLNLIELQEVASQEPLLTPLDLDEHSERSPNLRKLSLRAAAYCLSFQKKTLSDPRVDTAMTANHFAKDLCNLNSKTSGRQLFNLCKEIGQNSLSRKRYFNSILERIREGERGAYKTVDICLIDLSAAISHLPKEFKSEAESELNQCKLLVQAIEKKF